MPLVRALQTSDLLLRQMLANLPNGSVNVFDRELRYLFAAGRGLEQVGLSADSLVGMRLADVFDAESVAFVAPYFARALAGESVAFDLAISDRVYSINAGPLTIGEGRIDAIVAVAQDVTDRVAAEARERAARTELEAALRAREEFLDSLTHDLKTPLTTIAGLAQVMERQVARGLLDPEQLARSLGIVRSSASKMAGMVEELLDMARVQSGQVIELNRVPTDLVAIVRQAAAEQARAAPRHAVQVMAEEIELVGLFDASRLERVFANLLSNAVKYSPDGGPVTVTLRREHDDGRDWAVTVVNDLGLGVPAAELAHVFERFYRASNVAGRIPGSGIGLAGSRHIVERHGGSLHLESEVGRGTTATARLPLP